MEHEPNVSVTFGVEASQCEPHYFDLHDGDRIGIVLGSWLRVGQIYVRGTADELIGLADKLRAIVTAHESATTLAGEAAARVAAAANARDEHEYHTEHGYYPRTCAACAALPNQGRPVDASSDASS